MSGWHCQHYAERLETAETGTTKGYNRSRRVDRGERERESEKGDKNLQKINHHGISNVD